MADAPGQDCLAEVGRVTDADLATLDGTTLQRLFLRLVANTEEGGVSDARVREVGRVGALAVRALLAETRPDAAGLVVGLMQRLLGGAPS